MLVVLALSICVCSCLAPAVFVPVHYSRQYPRPAPLVVTGPKLPNQPGIALGLLLPGLSQALRR